MQDIIIRAAEALGPVLADLLILTVTSLAGAAVRWILVRTKADQDSYLAGALGRAQGSVERGVRAGTQRFGDLWSRIAEDGVITDQEWAELRDFAVQLGRDATSPKALKELEKVLGPDALAEELQASAEAAIQRLRERVGPPLTFEPLDFDDGDEG